MSLCCPICEAGPNCDCDPNQRIKLKKELLEWVRSGRKTATTRKGIKKYALVPTRLVDPNNDQNYVDVQVEMIERFTFVRLKTHPQLYAVEGYQDRIPFINAIVNIYGEMDNEQELTTIHFRKL